MNHLHYSAEAVRDLDEIWEHIAVSLGNPIAAHATVERIQDQIDRLSDFAELGTPMTQSISPNEYRYILSGSYLIFYECRDSAIYIDRVLYGRRDYLQLLFGETPPEDE